MEKMNILIVDDVRGNLLSLEAMLNELDQNLVLANSGTEALRQVLRMDFALILLDVKMPTMDGFETAGLIRQKEKSSHIPIIFLTAASQAEEQVFKGYSVGAVDFVFKPVVPSILKSKVRVFIELARVRAQLEQYGQEQARRARFSARKYETLMEHANDAIFILDPTGTILEANHRAEELLAEHREHLLQRPYQQFVAPSELNSLLEAYQKLAVEGTIFLRRLRLQRILGQEVWVDLSASLVQMERERVVIAIARDVTAQKTIEEDLRASLAEKAVLLKEVHHRVKNNLQVIASLINLQTANLRDPEALASVRVIQARVLAMALVHETLYRSTSLARVDFVPYLENLCSQLVRAYGVDTNRIRLEQKVSAVELSIAQAIPCGLLISELVTNAIKHAFPDGRPGQITVELHAESHGLTILEVADDGIGSPEAIESKATRTLGLELVTQLARQLNAKLECKRGPGTRYLVAFAAKEG